MSNTLVTLICFPGQLIFLALQLLFQTLSNLVRLLTIFSITPSRNHGSSFIENLGIMGKILSHVVDMKDVSLPLSVN